jgi:1,4-dihydroxy-6-naphthoate synthase
MMQQESANSVASATRLSVAYSPCPNDTFVFHAWTHGLLPDAPPCDVSLADIDVTNDLAARGEHDVLKISCAALPFVLDRYALLPSGGAVGRGCGPLVLVREGGDPRSLVGRRVAVPATRSTAYLLFRLWASRKVSDAPIGAPGGIGEIVVMPFHEIMPAVRDGVVDAGLVIHEARFVYRDHGLSALADMGEEWEKDTGLPVPLGAIVARRSLGARTLSRVAHALRASVRHAWNDPARSRGYIRAHAQEMEQHVVDQHIALYVNHHTEELGEDGYAAVRGLLSRAAGEGLVPEVAPEVLRFPGS